MGGLLELIGVLGARKKKKKKKITVLLSGFESRT
jgi:hypothetical protein